EYNAVRINKDLLRTMMHFDRFTPINEGRTQEASRTLTKNFLNMGVNVIVDDTNLNPNVLQSYVNLAKECNAKIQYEDLTDVDVETCIERDRMREKKVGKHVIQRMALQYLDYWK